MQPTGKKYPKYVHCNDGSIDPWSVRPLICDGVGLISIDNNWDLNPRVCTLQYSDAIDEAKAIHRWLEMIYQSMWDGFGCPTITIMGSPEQLINVNMVLAVF